MKKLLYIILLLPLWVNAQTNGTIQKTSATGTIRGSFGSLGLDTLTRVTGALVDGYILKYHAATNKWYASPDGYIAGLQDSLTKKANRTFDNVASGAIAKSKADTSASGLQTVSNLFPKGDTRYQKLLSGTGIVKSTAGVISYLTDPLPIANGGTGSATKNFVDLTTDQTIAGNKTLTGSTILAGTVLIGNLTPLANNGGGSFAPVEIAKSGDSGGIALSTDYNVAYGETYIAGFAPSSNSISRKAGVVEFRKASMIPLNETYSINLKATQVVSGTGFDRYGLIYWGGGGMSIFPASAVDTTLNPGLKIMKVNGVIAQTKMDQGTGGTDSVEVRDETTRQTKRISPTYYAATTGNVATATALQTARTIGGVSFDGTANITVASATGGFSVSGGNLTIGGNDITSVGHIGTTGSRVAHGWLTDLTVSNNISGSITGNASTVTTNANLTGPITSVGNTTSVGSQTGTGSTFVMNTSPILVTPAIGVATATSLSTPALTVSLPSGNIARFSSAIAASGTTAIGLGYTDGSGGHDMAKIFGQRTADGSGRSNVIIAVNAIDNDQSATVSDAKITVSGTTGITSIPSLTSTTQSASDNSTKVATTAYVDKFNLTSGTYTPTLTNGTNVSSSVTTIHHYTRVGNQVTVYGQIQVTPTTTPATNTVLGISLPIASNFTAITDLIGSIGFFNSLSTKDGTVEADTTNDRVLLTFTAEAGGPRFDYSFMYTVQ